MPQEDAVAAYYAELGGVLLVHNHHKWSSCLDLKGGCLQLHSFTPQNNVIFIQ